MFTLRAAEREVIEDLTVELKNNITEMRSKHNPITKMISSKFLPPSIKRENIVRVIPIMKRII